MFTTQALFEEIPKGVKVGIGCNGTSRKVRDSVRGIEGNAIVYTDPEKLVNDLANGTIDAAVRGDMSSSLLLPLLKKKMGVDELERVVFLQPKGRKMIMTAPVGIDEGWTIEQKHSLAVRGVELLKRYGGGTRIAVMSGGRANDVGRHEVVDKTICDAIKLVNLLRKEGYDAYHAEILIEEAVDDADMIIAPDGISGNLIFRALHFVGGAEALGAPVINIDKVFVDTSRAKKDYKDSIALAMKLTEGRI